MICQKALILDKLGGASEVKIKNSVFNFVLLSTCTNFGQLFTDSEKSLLPPVHRRCRAGRRPDFVRKTMQVHRRCTQLGPETRPAKCLAEEL